MAQTLDIQQAQRAIDTIRLLARHARTHGRTMRYEPEPFKDGTILELVPPRAFIEGVRDVGFEDVSEMEIACLMKVLAKPELDGAIILNEFVLIMENFGVPTLSEEDEYENDYIPDSDVENTPSYKLKRFDELAEDKKDNDQKLDALKKDDEANINKDK